MITQQCRRKLQSLVGGDLRLHMAVNMDENKDAKEINKSLTVEDDISQTDNNQEGDNYWTSSRDRSRFIRMTSRLLLATSVILLVGGTITSFGNEASWIAFAVTVSMAVICFLVANHLERRYGTKDLYWTSYILGTATVDGEDYYQALGIKFKIRKSQDLVKAAPKLYLSVAGSTMIMSFIGMSISNGLSEDTWLKLAFHIERALAVPGLQIKGPYTIAFVISALGNLILCCKANRAFLAVLIGINTFGSILGSALVIDGITTADKSGGFIFHSSDWQQSSKMKSLLSWTFLEGDKIYFPWNPLALLLTCKISAPSILFAFSVANVWSQISLFFAFEGKEINQDRVDKILAATGSILLVLTLALGIVSAMPVAIGIFDQVPLKFIYLWYLVAQNSAGFLMMVLASMAMMSLKGRRSSQLHRLILFGLSCSVAAGCGCLIFYLRSEASFPYESQDPRLFYKDPRINCKDSSLFCIRHFEE